MDVGRAAMRAATATLQAALEERNGWTGKPSNMIAEMSAMLAQALELPPGEVERVHTASLLHDLGKLAIPDEILDNPGELDDREWRVVSEHPKIGQVVLEQAGALRDAATIVLHHHEWYDGRGYPARPGRPGDPGRRPDRGDRRRVRGDGRRPALSQPDRP